MKGERVYTRGYQQALKDVTDELQLSLARLSQAADEGVRAMALLQLTFQEWAERLDAEVAR